MHSAADLPLVGTSGRSSATQLADLPQFVEDAKRAFRAGITVARKLFVREFRAEHRRSALGYLWVLIPVAAQALLWIFLSKARIVNSGETGMPYVAFTITGVLLWQGFFDALMSPLTSLRDAAPLLTRLNFPAEAMLLSGAAMVGLNTLVRLCALAVIYLIVGVSPGTGILLAPLGVLAILVLGFGVGLILAPFGVLYDDVHRSMLVATMFLWLATPVAYIVPTEGSGRYIGKFNPVAVLLSKTRTWLGGGSIDLPADVALVSIVALLALALGWVVFRVSIPHLVDHVGN